VTKGKLSDIFSEITSDITRIGKVVITLNWADQNDPRILYNQVSQYDDHGHLIPTRKKYQL